VVYLLAKALYLEREEVVSMVTYSDLFQFVIMLSTFAGVIISVCALICHESRKK
jgi:hypothetical protein